MKNKRDFRIDSFLIQVLVCCYARGWEPNKDKEVIEKIYLRLK